MALITQQLRTTDATRLPATLEPGQIAFNLANKWLMVGIGGADILTPHGPLTAAYSTTATVMGVNSVTVPAKPAAGKGYEIFDLEEGGVNIGTANPAVGVPGQLFVNTSGAKPQLLMYAGGAWGTAIPSPGVYTLTTTEVSTEAGADQSAKILAAIIKKIAAITAAGDLNTGDTCIVTGAAIGTDVPGSYIWDGSSWVASGAGLPDASTTTKGIVQLALDTDVQATGSVGKTTPSPLAVGTATQVVALRDSIAALQGGTALLGTYSGAASTITTLSPEATAAGRGGLATSAKLSAGTGLHAGDYFIVHAAGTIAGESAAINIAVNTGDTLMYDGAAWSVLPTGPVLGGTTITGCSDTADTAVATVAAGDIKGILVRDNTVADAAAGAYKLVSILDLGTF